MDFWFIDLDYDNRADTILHDILCMSKPDHWIPCYLDGSPVHELRAQVLLF